MFQNISANTDYVEEKQKNREDLKEIFIKQNFSKQSVLIYILAFMVSTVQFGNDMAPFAIAIIAAITANNIPILIPYVMTCIGTFIGFGASGLLTYILTSLIFMALSIFVIPKINEVTEQKRLMPHLIVATFLVQVVKILFGPILIYDILSAILFTIITCIFYKIFNSSISVIKDSKTKKAFAIEELIGTSLLIAIAIAAFREISLFGFSIRNILSVLVVLILGWQNGILVGATSGVTIGVVIAIIQNGDPVQIAAFAISGMIAGLLNKIGKIGVIIGFLLGNIILSYAANGNTHSVIMIQEILIASIGLLAMPKNMKINIEDFVKDIKYLPKAPDNRLEQKEDMVYKLNNVSDAISEMANTYKEAAATVLEEKEVEYTKNKEIFVTELENNINDLKDNVLYDDLIDDESPIVDDIFKLLTEKAEITRKELLNIFENHNNYILGFDDSQKIFGKKQGDSHNLKEENAIYSPLTGKVIPLSKVNDPAFSSGSMGQGCAIIPEIGQVLAPFDGSVVALFPTKHAIGLKDKDGIEVLIHVGLDTVNDQGKEFTSKVKMGDSIVKGQILIEFNIQALKDNLTTPVIITEGGEIDECLDDTKVQAGNILLNLKEG